MELTTPSNAHLAIYIHVPFCRKRCSYCHFDIKVFHPKTNRQPFVAHYLWAIHQELAHYSKPCAGRSVSSIFFGGGTPSQLDLSQISGILQNIQNHYELNANCEISMELNPEDVTPAYLNGLMELGITRISFGVQTFHPPGLEAIGRVHTAQKAKDVIAAAPPFPHGRSLDLILGLPHQTRATLQKDLEIVSQLEMDHVALYMLERDIPTPLDKKVSQDIIPNEDSQALFYEMVRDYLRGKGFRHYEISNFAKPGFECRHNSTYWRMGDYLGIGPAAHGRLARRYTANYAQLKDYLAAVHKKGNGIREEEHWTPERFHQEQIIQGLRLEEGVARDPMIGRHLDELAIMENHGLIHLTNQRLSLTDKGRLLGNEVFEIFM